MTSQTYVVLTAVFLFTVNTEFIFAFSKGLPPPNPRYSTPNVILELQTCEIFYEYLIFNVPQIWAYIWVRYTALNSPILKQNTISEFSIPHSLFAKIKPKSNENYRLTRIKTIINVYL